MADGVRPALGLSIGATNLASVTAERAITRKPVLTLFRQRPPEVGTPAENPKLDEPGLVITDFVDRVGDPIGIVAADGSVHRSEALTADGLRALAYTASGGRQLPEGVTVTHPAHWGPKAVEALTSALHRVSEWSTAERPVTVIPDAAAALFAVRANPGIPARGIIAVCDFGGSGTSITLVDAAGDYQPLAPTVRHHDFSGDLIDQALLTAAMDNVPSAGPFDPAGTSVIGSLARLRAACRNAKEQLSSSTATMLSDELPGFKGLEGDVGLTRNDLDEAVRGPLDNFMAVLEETLSRNRVRACDLVAVVSAGGGANIPAVTTLLSGHLRVPVVTAPRPHLTAAIGGALRAARGPGDFIETTMNPAAVPRPTRSQARTVARAPAARTGLRPDLALVGGGASRESDAGAPSLAWSAVDGSRSATMRRSAQTNSTDAGDTAARPALDFEHDMRPDRAEEKALIPWQRLPGVVLIGTAVAMLIVGIAVAVGLSSGDNRPATTPSSTSVPPPSASTPPANGAGPTAP